MKFIDSGLKAGAQAPLSRKELYALEAKARKARKGARSQHVAVFAVLGALLGVAVFVACF